MQVSRRNTVDDTLGEEASPGGVDRARKASQVRTISTSSLLSTLTSDQEPAHDEPVEEAEDVPGNTQLPAGAPQEQPVEADPDGITPASPRVTNPADPDTPASNRAIYGRDETPNPVGLSNTSRELPGTPAVGQTPRGGSRFNNVSPYPFPGPLARDPYITSPAILDRAQRQYVARAYQFLCQEIEDNMSFERANKLERINQVNNNKNQKRPNMESVELDMKERQYCIKAAFVVAHYFDRKNNGWNGKMDGRYRPGGWNGKFLGSRRLGKKTHTIKYKTNNKWVNTDWACGPHVKIQIPIPPHNAWDLLQRTDYGGLENGNFGSGAWRNEESCRPRQVSFGGVAFSG